MHPLQAIVLGVVQGLTEFLPISSTAHLEIVPALFHWPKPGAAFEAVIQLGTTVAVLAYFAKDIVATLQGMAKGPKDSPQTRLGIAVLAGTLPIAVLGLALKRFIPGFHTITVIGVTQIVMAIALLLAERLTKKMRPLEAVQLRDGLIVGFAQALALVPGASRSGSTLIGAFLTGLERTAALRFSFLLSLPATLLAGLFELKDVLKHDGPIDPGTMTWSSVDTALATLVSGIVGYACIAWLLRYLAKHTTLVFVVYRIVLGIVLLVLASRGWIAAG